MHDELQDDGVGHQEVEDEQDELVELGIHHIMDNGDEHEMDEIESHLLYHEQVFTMVEVVEDECIMGIIHQSDEMDEVEYDELRHSQQ